MKRSLCSRLLSGLLLVAMVLTMLPGITLAADTVCQQITTAEELTSGSYVLIADGYAPTVYSGGNNPWVLSSALTDQDGAVTNPADDLIWTITVANGKATLTDSNGVSIAPTGASQNGIQSGSYEWTVTVADGLFKFSGEGVSLAANKGASYKFRAYKDTTIEQQSYPAQFKLYKLDAGTKRTNGIIAPSELQDGDTIVIFNPANGKALSTEYTSFYNKGVDVTLTDGKLSGYTAAELWTVGIQEDGSYTFSTADGKMLSMGADYTSTPLDDVNKAWTLLDAKTEGCVYIQNKARANYLEWYASKGNWSSFGSIGDNEALFAQQLYLVVDEPEQPDNPDPPVEDPVLQNGQRVVIYNPAAGKALSTTYTGYFNNGTDVTLAEGKLTGWSSADVWTVGLNDDGSYTFSTAEGKKLAMGASYTSTPLNEVNTNWKITAVDGKDGLYYIENTGRAGYRLEWYADKGNWSAYTSTGEAFELAFYVVTEDPNPPAGDLPAEGDQVVLYNVSAAGVLAGQDDNTEAPSINMAAAQLNEGKAVAENGARVFTVEKNGEYFRFHNAHSGYLCSNGTGNNAFYSETASDDADWLLAEYNGGYSLQSRTAKYNGKYAQYLEYFGGAFKTYSLYNVTDPDIYTFHFYPCGNENVTKGVVNQPTVTFGDVLPAYVGQDYSLSMVVDAVFGVQTPYTMYMVKDADGTPLTEVTAGEVDLELLREEGTKSIYNVTIFDTAIARVTGGKMILAVGGSDTEGVAFTGSVEIEVKDEPVISDLAPAAGTQTGDNKRPEISASVANAGENPTITLNVNGTDVKAAYAEGKVTYTPAADLADGKTTVTLTVTRADGKSASRSWSFTVGEAKNQLYFGQLHSHTQYSDGAGSLNSALAYVDALPESANVDFVAFTDHSNYFDKSGAANPEGALYDMSLASESSQKLWNTYKSTVQAFNETHSDLVAIAGFEMTWSGGPGHINTFNTPGIVSRNNSTLNNKTSDAGMKAYYALLSQAEGVDSISQFNHPGTTFGNFSDFSYYDAVIDSRMFLVEVGNGEGAIGAGGYYPSYEQYIMALDKGWHVAPSNNQDNHKGKWGNANDARDVILADDFSEQGLYAAIRQLRVYSTEDKNLEVRYNVNGYELGSIIEEVPEKLNFSVSVYDPDASDSIAKVELVANSGKVVHTWSDPAQLAKGELSVTLDPSFSYYFVRVTQGDGDKAVTAPVWVGESLKLGISKVECGTSTPVTNEELTLTTTVFNSEASDATVKSVVYSKNGSVVLGTDTTGYTLAGSSTQELTFHYTPTAARVETITVTVTMVLDGEEYTYSKDITLDILNADDMVYIGIDAAHYNEYVAGNYKDSMGNFGELAAKHSVRTVELKTSEDLIAACSNSKYKALILTAPSRRLADAQADPKTYSAEELAAIQAFNAAGGTVIVAGWSDHYEDYPDALPAGFKHMAATQNDILEALGSKLRISDDATYDDVRSKADGVDAWRLYFNTYGDNLLTDGVIVDEEHPYDRLYTEVFSHYGGASVYAVDGSGAATNTLPEGVEPVVYGHATTYSKDTDSDGLGGAGTPTYAYAEGDNRLLAMAMEQPEGKGLIIVSGAAFMSNFEVQATISDNGSEKNYSNYKICENLLTYLNPTKVTPIAEVQAQKDEGVKYTIEGTVTSNASGYDTRTAFFDCIYLQDDTAGINAFPVAGNFKIGDRVRITGTTSSYQGERQINVSSIERIGDGEAVPAKEITAKQLNDGSVLGSLVTLKGTVESFAKAEGLVQTIMVRDAKGDVGRVFIDGYICTDEDVKNLEEGASITVTGLASYDNSFDGPAPRIRVRNRAEILCEPGESRTLPFEDVPEGKWYYEGISYGYFNGIFQGVSATRFDPEGTVNRAMVVTILYRMAGTPAVQPTSAFSDVAANRYYTKAVAWAVEQGIAKGYTDGTFRPEQMATRQELATFLYRFARVSGSDMTVSGDLSTFGDHASVAGWARNAMAWCVGNGLLQGDTRHNLTPTSDATRAQYATIVMRMMKNGVLK